MKKIAIILLSLSSILLASCSVPFMSSDTATENAPDFGIKSKSGSTTKTGSTSTGAKNTTSSGKTLTGSNVSQTGNTVNKTDSSGIINTGNTTTGIIQTGSVNIPDTLSVSGSGVSLKDKLADIDKYLVVGIKAHFGGNDTQALMGFSQVTTVINALPVLSLSGSVENVQELQGSIAQIQSGVKTVIHAINTKDSAMFGIGISVVKSGVTLKNDAISKLNIK